MCSIVLATVCFPVSVPFVCRFLVHIGEYIMSQLSVWGATINLVQGILDYFIDRYT